MAKKLEPAGKKFKLEDVDPSSKLGLKKEEAAAELDKLTARLVVLQERLYAEGKQSVLVVFQAMDTGGKDGTIGRVFAPLDAIGCNVVSFGKPSDRELAQDFLWRVHPHTPQQGHITIFNRSHYEDVLIVRVHGWVDKKTIERRYEHIANFERLLAERGTKVIKFFLHISPDEQKQRFEDRLANPDKRWKFNPADLPERAKWDDYMQAFEGAIRATSTEQAPWYAVPANRKWARDVLVAQAMVDAMEEMNPQCPEPDYDYKSIVIP